MSFNFLNPTTVSRTMFLKCVSLISEKDGMQLHLLNDAVMTEYKKNINDFLSYLITVGEYLEEYEKCSLLIVQQKHYKKWLQVNLETVKSISNLLNDLKHKHDEKENN